MTKITALEKLPKDVECTEHIDAKLEKITPSGTEQFTRIKEKHMNIFLSQILIISLWETTREGAIINTCYAYVRQ